MPGAGCWRLGVGEVVALCRVCERGRIRLRSFTCATALGLLLRWHPSGRVADAAVVGAGPGGHPHLRDTRHGVVAVVSGRTLVGCATLVRKGGTPFRGWAVAQTGRDGGTTGRHRCGGLGLRCVAGPVGVAVGSDSGGGTLVVATILWRRLRRRHGGVGARTAPREVARRGGSRGGRGGAIGWWCSTAWSGQLWGHAKVWRRRLGPVHGHDDVRVEARLRRGRLGRRRACLGWSRGSRDRRRLWARGRPVRGSGKAWRSQARRRRLGKHGRWLRFGLGSGCPVGGLAGVRMRSVASCGQRRLRRRWLGRAWRGAQRIGRVPSFRARGCGRSKQRLWRRWFGWAWRRAQRVGRGRVPSLRARGCGRVRQRWLLVLGVWWVRGAPRTTRRWCGGPLRLVWGGARRERGVVRSRSWED